MAVARELGMVPVGHVPFAVDIRTALSAGMNLLRGNPLGDLARLRSPEGVVIRGVWRPAGPR